MPNTKIGRKLFFFFIFISIIPVLAVNFLWFSLTKQQVTDPAAIQQIEIFASILFILTLVLVTLVSVWVSIQIIDPIKKLMQGSKTIGSGNLTYRLNIHSGDEMDDLGNTFNIMAANLQEAFHRLELSKNLDIAERDKLEITLASITDAVIAVDLARNVIIYNRAAERIIGYKIQEALGKKIDQLMQLSDVNGEIHADSYAPIILKGIYGEVFHADDIKIIGKDKISYVNLVTSQLKEGLSANLGSIITLHDIGKERQLEEMKLDFVSMAAHELRTPLTSVKGYLAVLIEEASHKLTPEENSFLNRISISVEQLMGLIENLLNVSRIERGVFTINLAPIDWVATVRETVTSLLPRATEKQIQLNFIEPQQVIKQVKADKLRVNEVIANILSNAITYTDMNGKITVWVEPRENEVITHVQDTGEGIPETAIPNLFTKFYRVSGKLGQGSKGTGLGLYISKSIIEMHHGKIWVASEYGKGSTFSFSIPTA